FIFACVPAAIPARFISGRSRSKYCCSARWCSTNRSRRLNTGPGSPPRPSAAKPRRNRRRCARMSRAGRRCSTSTRRSASSSCCSAFFSGDNEDGKRTVRRTLDAGGKKRHDGFVAAARHAGRPRRAQARRQRRRRGGRDGGGIERRRADVDRHRRRRVRPRLHGEDARDLGAERERARARRGRARLFQEKKHRLHSRRRHAAGHGSRRARRLVAHRRALRHDAARRSARARDRLRRKRLSRCGKDGARVVESLRQAFGAPELRRLPYKPALAASLKTIAAEGKDVFYRGALAREIVRFSEANGGLLSLDDFAQHTSTWVEPIQTDYRGYDVIEMPPNTQGMTVLQMLNILERYDLKSLGFGSAEYVHLLVEAKKLAFADRDRY